MPRSKAQAEAQAREDRNRMDADTQRRIEQAVLDVFAEREFHRVGLIEIARGANVSLQTLYKYYGSKEALLFSSIEAWLGQLAARMIDHLQGIEDYKERLRKVFWVWLDYIEKNPKVMQVMMSSVYLNTWRQKGEFEYPQLFGTFMKVLAEGRAKGLLTDEVEEKYLLDYIIGVLMRLSQMHILRAEKKPITAQANVFFEMLWRAIAKPE